MKKLVIICGLALLAGQADAQNRNGTYRAGQSRSQIGKINANAKGKGKSRRGPEPGRKFNISLGLSLALSNSQTLQLAENTSTGTLTRSASAFGVFVYPKYHFYSTEKFSLSVGIPLSLGGSGSASANSRGYGTESSFSFMYDLPLMIDYNGGCMSPANRNGESKLGYFGGVGIGIQNSDATNYSYSGTGNINYESLLKVKSVGPTAHAGLVFRVGNEDRPKFIGFRIAYKIGLNSNGHSYLTPSVFLNI